MVLAELRGIISRALQSMSNATLVDKKFMDDCLNDISRALLQADVQFSIVKDMQTNIKKTAIFNELCRMLDAGKSSFVLQKGKTSVVMFVGLQGSGKTTTSTKYANYYQNKGWKPTLVCADTFRAGAFGQLKHNATKAKIPFYGKYNESDPVKVVAEGVERLKQENRDLIIMDTSGRHKQDSSLFEEMRQVSEAMKPDLVVFVMDSNIGQATFNQALSFKQSVAVGALIITKMDGHAKGGGALSAVAASKSHVLFMGTREHMDKFEVFYVEPFVSHLLGVKTDQQSELLEDLLTSEFTLKKYQNLLTTCLIGQLTLMVPESIVARLMPNAGDRKRYMTIMDIMTNSDTNDWML